MRKKILETILDRINDGVAVIDNNSKIRYLNKQFCEQFGLHLKETVNKSIGAVHPLEVVANLMDSWDAEKEGEIQTIITIAKEDETINVNLSIQKIDFEGSSIYLVSTHPISSLMSKVNNIPSSILSEMLLDAIIDGIAIDDERGVLRYVNRAFAEMLGRKKEELIGQRWIRFTKQMDEDLVFEKIALRRIGESERYQLDWVRSDGVIVPTLISAAPYHKDGKFFGTVAIITDITELQRAHETIKFYFDLLTHDVFNQLQVIMTSAGLLDCSLPSTYTEDARQDIIAAVERCNRLITKVKRAAKMRELSIETIDLAKIVLEKTKIVQRVYEVKVFLENFDKPVFVQANSLIGELIWNLLENAVRHNPKAEKCIWITGYPESDFFVTEIADNGPGISDSRKAIIFSKLKRTGGVGLTLVSEMAKACGGRVEVHDRVPGHPDQGAKFLCYLPLAE